LLEQRTLLSVTFYANSSASPILSGSDQTNPSLVTNEPSLAVDPNDPANLAISAQSVLAYSSDDGANFSTVKSFTLPAGYTADFGDTWAAYNNQDQLFQTNLAQQPPPPGSMNAPPGAVAIAQINTSAGTSTSYVVNQPASGIGDDRQVMAADSNPSSPYKGNLYMIWSGSGSNGPILVSRSIDGGKTWVNTQSISAEATPWQPYISVGANGYVYAGYHAQPNFTTYTDSNGNAQGGFNPDGKSGEEFVAVSTDGGQNYNFPTDKNGNKVPVFGQGQADISWNVQADASNVAAQRTTSGIRFLTSGSSAPVVLADPSRAGRVYCIAADDPTNGGTTGDAANLYIATSRDNGSTWGAPQLLESGPNNSLQYFPAASVDAAGDLFVAWYDTRNTGRTTTKNSSGDYYLDVYAKYSTDGGATWSPSFRVNALSNPLDPFNGAGVLGNGFPSPPNTYRIGEYISTALYGGTAYVAWTGNTRDASGNVTGQQIMWRSIALPGSISINAAANESVTVQSMPGNSQFFEVFESSVSQSKPVYTGLWSSLSGGNIVVTAGPGDTINIRNLPANVSLQVNSNLADTVNVAPGGDQSAILGSIDILNSGFATLKIDDTEDFAAVGRTFTFRAGPNLLDAITTSGLGTIYYDYSSAFQPSITISGGNFGNTYDLERADASAITINGGAGGETFKANLAQPNSTTITLSGASGRNTFNTFNIDSLPAGTNTTIYAGSGADQINVVETTVTMSASPGSLSVNGGNSATLNLDDSGVAATNVAPPAGYVSEQLVPASISYQIGLGGIFGDATLSRTTTLTGYLYDFQNNLVVAQSFPSWAISYLDMKEVKVEDSPSTQTNNAFTVMDTIYAGLVQLSAQRANDSIQIGTATDPLNNTGSVNVNGTTGTSLLIDDEDSNQSVTADGYQYTFQSTTSDVVASTGVTRVNQGTETVTLLGVGVVGQTPFKYSTEIGYIGVRSVEIKGGSSSNTFDVQSTTPSLKIDAGPNQDSVQIGDASNSMNGIQQVNVVGAGNTSLWVDDEANQNTLTGSGGFGFGNVASTFATNPTFLITDSFVSRTNLVTQTVETQDKPGQPYQVTDVFPPYTDFSQITYSDLGQLKVQGGTTDNSLAPYVLNGTVSGNTFQVNSTSVPTVTIKAGPGQDTVQAGNSTDSLDNIGDLYVQGSGGTQLVLDDEANAQVSPSQAAILGVPVHYTEPTFLVNENSVERDNAVEEIYRGITSQIPVDAVFSYQNLAGITVVGGNLFGKTASGSGFAGNTFDVQSTLAGTPVTIKGGAGFDTINAASTVNTFDPIQGVVWAYAKGSHTTLNVYDQGNSSPLAYQLFGTKLLRFPNTQALGNPSQTINYFNINHIYVHGGTASEVWYIDSTLAGTTTDLYSDGGTIPTQNFFVIDSSLDGIQGPLAVHGGGVGPSYDYLRANDTSNAVGHTYTLSTGELQRNGMANITYDNLGEFAFYAASNQFGHAPANTINVQSIGNILASVSAGAGDTVKVGQNGNMSNILGSLVIRASAPAIAFQVTLDDSADPQTGKQVTASSDSYAWGIGGLSPGHVYLPQETGLSVQVLGGSPAAGQTGGNTYDIQSVPAGVSLAVNAGKGTDTVNVGSDPVNLPQSILDGIQGAVNVNGTGGNTTLNINDQATSSNQVYDIYAAKVDRTLPADAQGNYVPDMAPITYHNIQSLTLNAGNGSHNVLVVDGTSAGTTIDVYGGSNHGGQYTLDEFVVSDSTTVLGQVHLHGRTSPGGYSLALFYDQSTRTLQTYTLTPGALNHPGLVAPITYDGMYYDILYTSESSPAAVNVQGVAANTPTYVSLDRPNQQVTVGTQVPGLGSTLAGIQGTLVVETGIQPSSVVIDDSGDTQTGRQVTFSNDPRSWGVSGLSPGRIDFTGAPSVQVLGGSPAANQSGGNTFDVESVPAAISLALNAGKGADTVNVGSDPVNLSQSIIDPIQGTVTLTGQVGNTALNVNDEGTSSGQQYEMFATKITRTPYNPPSPLGNPTQTINYANVAYVNVYGGRSSSAEDVLGVDSTSGQTTRTALYSEGDHDELVVEGQYGTLDGIQGPLTLHGVGAEDVAIANDAGNTIGHSYTFTTGQLQRGGMANITYDGVIEFGLYAANNQYFGHTPNTVSVQSLGAVLAGVVVGAGDTVTVGQNGSLANVLADLRIQSYLGVPKQVTLDDSADTTARTVTLGSDPTFSYLVSGLANSSQGRGNIGLALGPATPVSILGGPADKVFRIHDFTGAPAISIVAEPATSTRTNMHNKLDYSGFSGPVLVSLPLGYATGFAKVSGIQDVAGSQGNNLLVGDTHPNNLVGGTGRNVLIGEGGGDTLDASLSHGDNMLIGGRTDWDMNLAALQAIMKEWDRTDLGFNDRRGDLLTGANSLGLPPENVVGTQLILLKPATNATSTNGTVHANAFVDTLIGSNAIDPATGKRVHNWFFYSSSDVIKNYVSSSDKKDHIT
jgi:hypothetical protein